MSQTGQDLASHILEHPSIGCIQGISKLQEVTQYLGIQYATLKDRFSRGELKQYSSAAGSILDATTYGPIPMSPSNGCEWEHTLIQQSLPFYPRPQSDTECLTLNISVPKSSAKTNLPVLVFVHGGAFATGSSSYPQYDLARFTALSAKIGKPIVAVSINYRLGAPGFMYSPEMRDAGYKPNNGLDDQKLALRWIKHFIGGFGGDLNRVTFMGESAGAASSFFHLHSEEPLFHQIVAMSGSSQQRLKPLEASAASYQSVAKALGVADLPTKEKLQRIIETPIETFMASVGRKFPLGPLVDDETIPTVTTYKALGDSEEFLKLFPGLKHCKRLMMGDCQMDGMAFGSRLAGRSDVLPKTMEQCMSHVFDPIDRNIAPSLVAAYGIDSSVESNSFKATEPILNFANDIMFALPTTYFSKAWSQSSISGTDAFICHFNCPNPWNGPWKGYATHIQDIAFVLQNYNEHLSKGQRLCAERYARDIIAFTNGEQPWPAYQESSSLGAMVYYASTAGQDESGYACEGTPQQTRRRDILERIVGLEHLDKAVDVWQMFMAGPR
ncbi:hypothetical protein FOCG_11821 [Fusarium oxysporum f. sp. radicis-lycopersici 26381]|nr:hypothetical protein FOWG_12044 [Fusarium oxysporum f. sp. lycopersici MN25]EXL47666.1 hypothetical protein FOCG_11821 [Fusarium oxysporum f. sp. radicis-lycopersici 26381]